MSMALPLEQLTSIFQIFTQETTGRSMYRVIQDGGTQEAIKVSKNKEGGCYLLSTEGYNK
jgi:hypothetical protein